MDEGRGVAPPSPPPVRLLAEAGCQTVKVGPPTTPFVGALSTPAKAQPVAASWAPSPAPSVPGAGGGSLAPGQQSTTASAGVDNASEDSAAGGEAATPGAARLRPLVLAETAQASAAVLATRLAATQEKVVALRAANSILLQQVKNAKRVAMQQKRDQEELFAEQLRKKDEEATKYQSDMDARLLGLQQQMQLGMAASVAKVNELKDQLQAAEEELRALKEEA